MVAKKSVTDSFHIEEIEAKSILRTHKKIDSWFITHYGLNLYRGCSHNCIYCDDRTEKYQVDSAFGYHITVKSNVPELLPEYDLLYSSESQWGEPRPDHRACMIN